MLIISHIIVRAALLNAVERELERVGACLDRGNILHTRNQHLRKHRGFSVACSNGFSVAFSTAISLFSGIFQRRRIPHNT